MMIAAPFSEKTSRLLRVASITRWGFHVILILDEGFMNSAEICKRLGERSNGQIQLRPSSVNQALNELRKGGLVMRVKGASGHMNSLTRKGREDLSLLASLGLLV